MVEHPSSVREVLSATKAGLTLMPAWPTCRGLPTNATPDQILDSESSSEGYEDIVQVLQDNDACEFDDSSNFEVQVKGNLRKNLHF